MTGPPDVTLSLRIEATPGVPLGFLEIDRVVAGRCCGGVRMTPSVDAPELRRLARIMTLKCGYLGLASGGAKAGIVLEPGATPDGRAARVRAFGLAIGPLVRSGLYSMGTDLGTTQADVASIRGAAGLSTGGDSGSSSGDFAGMTVALATVAALRARGIEPRGARVAIQGAGSVGLAAMAVFRDEGVRVVAAATIDGTLVRESGLDVDAMLEGARRGDPFVSGAGARPPEAVLKVECDVLIPCAGSATIDAAAAATLPASIVVCGANDPFAAGAEERLLARHVLLVPDFVANGGGVLGSTLASAVGATPSEVEALMRRHFLPRVAATLELARKLGEPVAEPARREALDFLAACDRAYGSTRPPTLLPEALAPRPSAGSRLLLALERRAHGSRKLAPLGRRLRPVALRRVDDVLRSAFRERATTNGPAPAPKRLKRALLRPLRGVARSIPQPVRYGRGFRRAWAELKASDRLDAQGLRAMADGKLRRIVAHAYEQVPYYRELFDRERIDPRDIRGVADLPRIPILTKAILRERFEDLKARDFAAHRPSLRHSGGSTGEQTHFYLSRRAIDTELAAAWRHYHEAGYRFGDRCASLYLPLEGPAADLLCYESWKSRTLLLNTRLFTGERMRAMIDAVVAYRADILWAYPSHLEMLCRYVEETGDDRFRPRAVVTNAEVLYDAQRTRARELLGCDVFDWYGLAEHAAAAAECERHGYHIPEELVAVELVTAQGEAPVGEPGDIIGTSLENYAQPFLRYRTGDYASWREGACACGRAHRMLKEIGGRTQDVITTPNGVCTFRHGALSLEGIPGLEAVQIEQCEVRRFVVRAVAPGGLSDDAKQRIATSLVRALAFEAAVEVVQVDRIPRTERGKHQLVISHVPFSFAKFPAK